MPQSHKLSAQIAKVTMKSKGSVGSGLDLALDNSLVVDDGLRYQVPDTTTTGYQVQVAGTRYPVPLPCTGSR